MYINYKNELSREIIPNDIESFRSYFIGNRSLVCQNKPTNVVEG
jgi:hypothetical protein